MSDSPTVAADRLRWIVYGLLIITSAATMTGRILSVQSKSGKTAMLSANDRSRWCTIRALVDHGTYAIDDVIRRKTDWYTIDMVRHRGADGREHYYSSKPPLLSTLLAGQYWLIQTLTGVNLADNPFYVARLMLIVSNVLPLMLYWVVLTLLVETLSHNDWSRLFVMAAATWGTFLSTFAVTLNNHIPGAISVLLATYAAVRILHQGDMRGRWFVLAGLSSAFAVTSELPALALFAMYFVVLLAYAPRQTLGGFVPPALVVASAFFFTNDLAHQSWRPPYAHRGDGAIVATLPRDAHELRLGTLSPSWVQSLAAAGVGVSAQTELIETSTDDRGMLWDASAEQRYSIRRQDSHWEVRAWDHWYEYAGSYWTDGGKTGVDLGEPSRGVYLFHMLLGHHGIFSLTPIWLLSGLGIGIWLRHGERSLQGLALMVLLLTGVCMAFYVSRGQVDRNYGGVSCGFRWLFWFIPLWLLCILPATDLIARWRASRVMAWVLFALSVISATYANVNPWSHPWIFDYWTHLGWIQY